MNKISRIKPAGWLVLTVVAVLVLAVLGLGVQAVLTRVRGLDALQPMAEYTPPPVTLTITPRPTVTPTPAPTDTPAGWTVQKDIAGDEYLAPPPEEEAAIREAFEAVSALLAVADVPDDTAMEYDWNEIVAHASEFAESRIVEYYDGYNMFVLVEFGPENPVRCESYDTCTVMRAKMGSSGTVVYDENLCMTSQGVSTISQDHTQCVFREFTDQNPYQVYIATVSLQEDDVWRATDWQIENISPPSQ